MAAPLSRSATPAVQNRLDPSASSTYTNAPGRPASTSRSSSACVGSIHALLPPWSTDPVELAGAVSSLVPWQLLANVWGPGIPATLRKGRSSTWPGSSEVHDVSTENRDLTKAAPRSRPGLLRTIAHRLARDVALPIEGRLASFDGATSWINSEPLTPERLRGRVVLVNFWT